MYLISTHKLTVSNQLTFLSSTPAQLIVTSFTLSSLTSYFNHFPSTNSFIQSCVPFTPSQLKVKLRTHCHSHSFYCILLRFFTIALSPQSSHPSLINTLSTPFCTLNLLSSYLLITLLFKIIAHQYSLSYNFTYLNSLTFYSICSLSYTYQVQSKLK